MTIKQMEQVIMTNANEVKEIGQKIRYTRKDKVEQFNRVVKNYSDVAKMVSQQTTPKKAEVERIMKMSNVLVKKVRAI